MHAVFERWAFAPRVERWAFNAMHAVVAVTGAAYFWMKYLLATDDPFALINHPWQPAMLTTHVVAGPGLILFYGMVFRSHMLWRIQLSGPQNRLSGWISLFVFLAMALSGYLIQVASTPERISLFIWSHVAASVVFVVAYGVHLIVGYRLTRRMREPPW